MRDLWLHFYQPLIFSDVSRSKKLDFYSKYWWRYYLYLIITQKLTHLNHGRHYFSLEKLMTRWISSWGINFEVEDDYKNVCDWNCPAHSTTRPARTLPTEVNEVFTVHYTSTATTNSLSQRCLIYVKYICIRNACIYLLCCKFIKLKQLPKTSLYSQGALMKYKYYTSNLRLQDTCEVKNIYQWNIEETKRSRKKSQE